MATPHVCSVRFCIALNESTVAKHHGMNITPWTCYSPIDQIMDERIQNEGHVFTVVLMTDRR